MVCFVSLECYRYGVVRNRHLSQAGGRGTVSGVVIVLLLIGVNWLTTLSEERMSSLSHLLCRDTCRAWGRYCGAVLFCIYTK